MRLAKVSMQTFIGLNDEAELEDHRKFSLLLVINRLRLSKKESVIDAILRLRGTP
jgi:hypothetical protein